MNPISNASKTLRRRDSYPTPFTVRSSKATPSVCLLSRPASDRWLSIFLRKARRSKSPSPFGSMTPPWSDESSVSRRLKRRDSSCPPLLDRGLSVVFAEGMYFAILTLNLKSLLVPMLSCSWIYQCALPAFHLSKYFRRRKTHVRLSCFD